MSHLFNKLLNFSIQKRGRDTLNLIRKLSFEGTKVPILSSYIPISAQVENNWIYQRNERIQMPVKQKFYIELPKTSIVNPIVDDTLQNEKVIDLPSQKDIDYMEAARMIVIRRQKMKNHKLKKLRKRLKFARAKVRQKRELKKEKEFQATLIQKCKEAEMFSAEEYVETRIQKYKEALAYVPKEKKTFYW